MKRIPPFQLVPVPLNEEARQLPGFEWAKEDIGKRHKLGGLPDFVRIEDYPKCAHCNEVMMFYAQLDSINDDYVIADCGVISVFLCFECIEVQTVIGSY